MGIRGSRRTAFSLGLVACALSSSGALWVARAQAAASWRAADAAVTVNCPLTVGGSFDATTASLEGALTADPSKPDREKELQREEVGHRARFSR